MQKAHLLGDQNIKLLAILFSLFIAISLFSKPIDVLEQTNNYITVKFTLPEYNIEDIEQDGEMFHQIITNASNIISEEGKASLPYFSEILGIPADGDIQIEIIKSSNQTLDNINIVPSRKLNANANIVRFDFYQDEQFYKSSKKYPAKLIEKGEISFLRDRALISFRINPFQYIPHKQKLEITTSLIAKIYIRGDKTTSRNWHTSNNYIDKVGDSFFLNNATSKTWRKNREPATSYPTRNTDIISDIKIVVNEEGIYKITKQHLENTIDTYLKENNIELESEFDWDNLDPRYLGLSDENGNTPIHFIGENDGSFDNEDYFEFFGEPHYGDNSFYDDYTNENTYRLKLVNNMASRMAVENGGLQNSNPKEFIVPSSFEQTIHIEKQENYFPLGNQFDNQDKDFYREDLWFWSKINAPNLKIYPFELQHPHDSNIRKIHAKVCLFGASFDQTNPNNLNHHAIVRINSSLIGNKTWAGQKEVLFENENPISNTNLNNGTNNLYISLPGVAGYAIAQILLDYLELTYWREYKTSEDFIKFQKPSNKPLGLYQFEIENFSSSDISVYKIGSSYMENPQITSFTEAGDAPFKVTFQDSVFAENYQYLAITESMKKTPSKIIPDIPSNLKSNNNSADYVIITITDFANNEGTLLFKELRESEGHSVQIVKLEDIFDEFNFGIRSIEAMKDFVSYAYNNWSKPQLTHILLLGDGLNDERDLSPDRQYNLIPFKKVWVPKKGAIASDNWLGCIVGDDMIPDVSISRISVWDEEQILPVAQKSQNYLESPNFNDLWHSNITLAAGGNPSEGTLFAKQSERIRNNKIPEDYNVKRVYCNVDDLPNEYAGNTTSLLSSINDGTIYMQFMGHGGGHVWADYNLLNIADINTFNNDNYPFVSSFACYGSAFNYRQSSCIGEELILTEDKGAIAHFGFSGYGYLNSDEYFSAYLNEALFQLKLGNIGNATDYAKARFYADSPTAEVNYSLIQGGVLLGDNMATFVYPETNQTIILEDYHLEAGDTLKVSSLVGDEIFSGKFIIYDENDSQLRLNEYYPLPTYTKNGELSVADDIIPSETESALRYVKVFGYGAEKEICGRVSFTVGNASVQKLLISPAEPTAQDSVNITADFITDDEIVNINLIEYTINKDNAETIINTFPMELISGITYTLSEKITPHLSSDIVRFYFVITNKNEEKEETQRFYYNIKMADIFVQHGEIGESNNLPVFKIYTSNLGDKTSADCYYRLYRYEEKNYVIVDSTEFAPIAPSENRWDEIAIPLYTKPTKFRAIVNEDHRFAEPNNYNNNKIETEYYEFNMFEAGLSETNATSSDGNLKCQFPPNLLSQNTVFYINNLGIQEPLNQPNANPILLADSLQTSSAYEIGAINSELLADTLGHFAQGKTINLKFYYSTNDSLTQYNEKAENFEVYRWEPQYSKWISQKGNMSLEQDFVSVNVNRLGIYTILQNQDNLPPFVEANVEGQEFTYGGYVAHDGIISLLLSDANGIDIFDNKVQLFLDANSAPLDESDYAITASAGNLTNIPMKYQLNLEPGEHFLTIDCSDVNGNLTSHEIKFSVNNEFALINVANYPNPVKSQTVNPVNEGRTRFTYVLTDDADEINIKIYTVSGRLVKTFKDVSPNIGYHEYPRTLYGWDCRDDLGYPLANGVYFYKITAKKGRKTTSKTMKMAILK